MLRCQNLKQQFAFSAADFYTGLRCLFSRFLFAVVMTNINSHQGFFFFFALYFLLPTSTLTCLLSDLITYSMEQRPSWEANKRSFSQSENSRHFMELKVYCRIQKSQRPVLILREIDPAHDPHPTFQRSILVLSSHLRLGLSSGSPSIRFPNQNSVCTSSLPIHATCPVHLVLDMIQFNHLIYPSFCSVSDHILSPHNRNFSAVTYDMFIAFLAQIIPWVLNLTSELNLCLGSSFYWLLVENSCPLNGRSAYVSSGAASFYWTCTADRRWVGCVGFSAWFHPWMKKLC
jgi:hypothetical protein